MPSPQGRGHLWKELDQGVGLKAGLVSNNQLTMIIFDKEKLALNNFVSGKHGIIRSMRGERIDAEVMFAYLGNADKVIRPLDHIEVIDEAALEGGIVACVMGTGLGELFDHSRHGFSFSRALVPEVSPL
jgi:hypothetical protein